MSGAYAFAAVILGITLVFVISNAIMLRNFGKQQARKAREGQQD